MNQESTKNMATTSTGHELSEAGYLDARFLFAQPEYEAMLQWVEIQPGWHVLDAGAGNGSFLPLLCELVGASGTITALDLAPENIQACDQRIRDLQPTCRVETKVGNVLQLPYDNGEFDAVWSANITQYLTEDELAQAFSEFRRVTRQDGLVAIKEADATCIQIGLIEPTVLWRSLAAMRPSDQQIAGILRAIELPQRMKKAGMHDVYSKTLLIERAGPVAPIGQVALGSLLRYFGQTSLESNLSEDDYKAWHNLLQLLEDGQLFDESNFFFREGAIVVVGHAP